MRRRLQQSRREAGFTLVEVLVATALIGLISLLLIEAARFASVGYERRLELSDASKQHTIAVARLRALFESATPAVYESDDGDIFAYFDGDPQTLQFVAPYALLGARDHTGLALIRLQLEPDDAPQHLTALHQPFALGGEAPAVESMVLADGVVGLDIAYFDPGFDADDPFYASFDLDNPTDQPIWRETWKGHSTQPALVRLRITDANGLAWPDLIAAPRARRPAE